MHYFFILGRNPALSVAEIEQVLYGKIKERYFGASFYIIDTESRLDVEELRLTLGGLVKIGQIILKTSKEACFEETLAILKKGAGAKKLNFSINDYGYAFAVKDALRIKKQLIKSDIKARFVFGKDPQLSSVSTQKNILDKDGIELNCFKIKKQIWLGQTLACQPFAALSRRDFGRPARDHLSGMLPPKIAKIMINLGRFAPPSVLLDPFAGSGTILMEAALMNYKNLIGSDVEEKSTSNALENLKWLVSRGFVPAESIAKIKIFQADARELDKKIPVASIDGIVTEPYLGPPLSRRVAREQILKIKSELEQLYLLSFEVFKKILKPGGKIVIIFPVFMSERKVFLDILERIEKLGFEIKNPTEQCGIDFSKSMPRGGIIYSRPDQRVAREIFIFEKT
ncbi:hypothetical protein KKD84_04945 [Patescibacteria group bacterium]|nr:hypothetical protein [Patescibacteria group bacterium]